MNKDYCFTFQQRDFDYEPQNQNYQITAKKSEEESTTVSTNEVVPDEEDVDEIQKKYKQKSCSGYYFNAAAAAAATTSASVANKNKLCLNLNAEQITLKSQNKKLPTTATTNSSSAIIDKFTINKSMAARRALSIRNVNDNKQQQQQQRQKINGINFKIAPMNNNNNNNKEDDQQNLPEIVLNSFETATTTGAKIMPKKCSVKFQGIHQPIVVNQTHNKMEDSITTDAEDSSELTSLPGGSTSPESILDNILSAASSVSVRSSSSLSSVGSEMTQLGVKEPKKTTANTSSIMPQVVILHANDDEVVEQQKQQTPQKERETTTENNMPSFLNWPSTKKKSQQLEQTLVKSRLSVTPQLTPISNNSGSSTRSQRSRCVNIIRRSKEQGLSIVYFI